MTEAAANISWLPFDPRDWEQLTPAFGRFRSMVGAHGPKLIANNRAATFFNRCVHDGRLELALVAPDHLTYRLFDEVERQKLTIRVPFNYEEGCGIEPYYDGCWYVRRFTAIPVLPGARAETPPASPTEPPRVEPGRDVGVADEPSQSPHQQPKRKPKRKLKRKPRRKAVERIYNHEAITGAGNRVLGRDRRMATVLPPIERQKTKPWITNEAVQMKKDDKIPADIGISKFARELERRMREAAKTDRSVRPVKWTYLKNHLSEWDLWPVSKIKTPRNS